MQMCSNSRQDESLLYKLYVYTIHNTILEISGRNKSRKSSNSCNTNGKSANNSASRDIIILYYN
jgi:hypothetical protein